MSNNKKSKKRGPAKKKEIRQRPSFKEMLNSPLPFKKLQMITFADALAFFFAIDATLVAIVGVARYYPTFAFWIFAIMLVYLPLVYLYNYLRYRRKTTVFSMLLIVAALVLVVWFFPKYSLVSAVNTTGYSLKDAGASDVTFVKQSSYVVPLTEKSNFFCESGYCLEFEVDGERKFYNFNSYTGTYTALTEEQQQELLDEEAAAAAREGKSFFGQLLGLE